MALVLSLSVSLSAAETRHKDSSKPLKFAKRTREPKTPIYNPRKGKTLCPPRLVPEKIRGSL
jgi:hypothetical protein